MLKVDKDLAVRLTAFDWLAEQTAIHGDVLPRKILEEGFLLDNDRIHLVAPQGIFKPQILDLPLSIATVPGSPYKDKYSGDGFLHYKYRGSNPNHRDNVGLRKLMEIKRPLIYFHGVVPGQYMAVWPVYIVGDNQADLSFTIAVDDASSVNETMTESVAGVPPEIRRAYITSIVKNRLHQRLFRERVLDAYQSKCSFCNLRHRELLDAAHIVPDADPLGEPRIINGLALCKLHHAAFDSFMLGVSPDYIIHVRQDILEETDGPTLRYGLQGINQSKLLLPREKSNWPAVDLLNWRWQKFKKVS